MQFLHWDPPPNHGVIDSMLALSVVDHWCEPQSVNPKHDGLV